MVNLSNLLIAMTRVNVPKLNLVGRLVGSMFNWLGTYALTVIVFTIFLRLILLPIDYLQRYSGKKNAIKLKKIQPQIDRLQKQYGDNKELLNQKMMELQKKEGYSPFATCLPTIITMVIFFIMFSGLNSYTKYYEANEYNMLAEVYETTYNNEINNGGTATTASAKANDATLANYLENQQKFLWVKNIWQPDSWRAPFLSGQSTSLDVDIETGYDIVTGSIQDYYKKPNGRTVWNGYLILPVVIVGIMFLSTKLINKAAMEGQVQTEQTNQQTKMMNIIMPIMFGIFSVFYSTAFALYMLVNSVLSVGSTLLSTWIANIVVKKKGLEEAIDKTDKPSYMR